MKAAQFMVLEELPLKTCNAFWHPKETRITAYEKFKVLSIPGESFWFGSGGILLSITSISPISSQI